MNFLSKEGSSERNIPLLLLLVVGVIEFLFITLESLFSGIGYYLAETYVVVPCLLLLGYALREKPTAFAQKRLLLASIAIFWFVIVQSIHKISGMENHPMGTVFLVYLMAFPFAALAEDRDNRGLWWIGGMFVTASLVLVFYTVLLLLNRIPAGLEGHLFWDGARLHPLWHPNIAASYFMMGIGFCLVFCTMARKPLAKAALILAILLQLMAMALTNCRTTLLLTGALLGGTLFFLIFKSGWKRFVLGLVAAALVLVCTFKVSGMLFQWNNDRLLASFQAVQEEPALFEEAKEVSLASEIPAEAEAQEDPIIIEDTGIISGDNQQGSLMNDLRSLNGRTYIWEATLKAVQNDRSLKLWGTEYSGTIISIYHWFDVDHAHNSWLETLMRMGIPGLVIALVFTALSAWSGAKLLLSQSTPLWQKIAAMLTLCIMATGFLEPYLFITNVYYHVTDFAFFFLTGYLDYWCGHKQKQAA